MSRAISELCGSDKVQKSKIVSLSAIFRYFSLRSHITRLFSENGFTSLNLRNFARMKNKKYFHISVHSGAIAFVSKSFV